MWDPADDRDGIRLVIGMGSGWGADDHSRVQEFRDAIQQGQHSDVNSASRHAQKSTAAQCGMIPARAKSANQNPISNLTFLPTQHSFYVDCYLLPHNTISISNYTYMYPHTALLIYRNVLTSATHHLLSTHYLMFPSTHSRSSQELTTRHGTWTKYQYQYQCGV